MSEVSLEKSVTSKENSKKPLVSVKNLKKQFRVQAGMLKAVNGLTLDIYEGETIGLVGESGCGKSTAGRTILRFFDEDVEGDINYNGIDVMKANKAQLKELRKEMQLIFQDPYAALNGRMTIQNIITEPLDIHNVGTKEERLKRVDELLELVGLLPEHKGRFPHEFSGGQRQRICIARALALNPKFVVCDEPIASLDVSIQAQIVNLFKELQDKFGLTYLFIAHDLSMVKYISDKIMVLYLGNMMEYAESEVLCSQPLHPYTQALMAAVPMPDPDCHNLTENDILEGEIPNPVNPPSGCVFHTRCRYATELCKSQVPNWVEDSPGHFVACHHYKDLKLKK